MKKICADYPLVWTPYKLDLDEAWSSIRIVSNLKKYLNEDNHIKEIQNFFTDAFKKYDLIKTNFKDLI